MSLLYDVRGAARLLGVKRSTIKAYMRNGKLRSVRVEGVVSFEEDELQRFKADERGDITPLRSDGTNPEPDGDPCPVGEVNPNPQDTSLALAEPEQTDIEIHVNILQVPNAWELVLTELTDSQLVSSPDTPEKQAEIERRLALTSQTNQLAYRFAITDPGSDTQIRETLQKLIALCKEAVTQVGISLKYGPREPGDKTFGATLTDQIELFICFRLLPIRQQTRDKITLEALQQAFGTLASEVAAEIKANALDHRKSVRKGLKPSRRKSPSLDFVIGVDEQGHTLTVADKIGQKTITPRCALGAISTWDKAVDFVISKRLQLIDVIGHSAYRTLLFFMQFAAGEETTGVNYRDTEKILTDTLQQRGVSPQQARADKRQLRTAMQEALKANNPLIVELKGILEEPRRTIFDDLLS